MHTSLDKLQNKCLSTIIGLYRNVDSKTNILLLGILELSTFLQKIKLSM